MIRYGNTLNILLTLCFNTLLCVIGISSPQPNNYPQAIENYNKAYYIINKHTDYDSAIFYGKSSFQYFQKNNYDSLSQISSRVIGVAYIYMNQIDSSLKYFGHARYYAFLEKDSSMIANTFLMIASLYSNSLKNYSKGFIYQDSAEQFLSKSQFKEITFSKLSKGIIYTNLNEYTKALKEFKEGLIIAEENNFIVGSFYANIGTVYSKMKNYKKAIKFHFMSLNESKDSIEIANTYHNIGLAYQRLEIYDSAIYYSKLSLEIYKRKKYSPGVFSSLLNEFEIYYKQGDSVSARPSFIKIDTISLNDYYKIQYVVASVKLNSDKFKFDVIKFYLDKAVDLKFFLLAKNLIEVSIEKIEEEKDFEKIHFFSKKLKTIEDSLDLEKKLIESFIYEIQIAEDEKNKASQTLFESSIYYMLLTIFVSIIFIVIFLFVYKYYVKNKNLLKRKEKEQNDLKKSMLDITIENQKNQKIINEIHVDISKINKSTSEYNKNSVFKELHLKVNQHISSQEENEILKKQLDQIKSDFLSKFEKIASTPLTSTENKIIVLLKINLSSKEIASILNISNSSVEVYRSNIRKKLSIPQRVSITKFIKKTWL